MNIVFFGSDNFAVIPLRALIKAGYRILSVLTQPDRKKGRGLRLEGTPVKMAAKEADLKIYQPIDVNSAQAIDFLKKLNPDLFIVIAYGQILSQDIINLPKIFSINAHASLLPKYRGAAPVNWVIIKGEKYSGVTIMKITQKLDAGPIILQKEMAISDEDSAVTLQDKLSQLAADLLLDALVLIKNNNYKLIPQDETKVSLAPKLKKSDGRINWSLPAQEIYNLIRGCLDWPGAFTYYQGKILKINKAVVCQPAPSAVEGLTGLPACPERSRGVSQLSGTIVEVSKAAISVVTGEGILAIEELQLEGKRNMKAEEFIAGHKISVGEILGNKK